MWENTFIYKAPKGVNPTLGKSQFNLCAFPLFHRKKTNYQSTSEKASLLCSLVCFKSFGYLQSSLDL